MKWLSDLVEKALDWTGRLPSTNARIGVSLVLAIATGVRVLVTWTAPPSDWLIFLGAMMGLDVAQFAAKRLTHAGEPTPAPKPPDSDGTAG